MNDASLIDILERLRQRHFGKYRGTVTDVDLDAMRVKALVPSVLGTQETGWCMPCVPYAGDKVGFAFMPEVKAGVWIEFEGGDVSYPIWTGCYWHTGEVPALAKKDVKTITTTSENQIVLDDSSSTITFSDKNGNEIVLDASGVTLKRGGQTIVLSDSSVNIDDGALEVV